MHRSDVQHLLLLGEGKSLINEQDRTHDDKDDADEGHGFHSPINRGGIDFGWVRWLIPVGACRLFHSTSPTVKTDSAEGIDNAQYSQALKAVAPYDIPPADRSLERNSGLSELSERYWAKSRGPVHH
jgi:hypothetical protein